MIAGCVGTSCVLTGKLFDVPVMGTHAHSWIMSFPDEYTAFKAYADLYPEGCTLLVDTYDTLKSGVPNAIRVFQEMKDAGISPRKLGIRLDSGDLAYLSKKARKMLDEAGFEEATICASNDLDEYLIHDLKMQGAAIDSWGVGTNLITSKDCLHSVVYISSLPSRIRMASSNLKSNFLRTQKRSPIRATRRFTVFTKKKPAR